MKLFRFLPAVLLVAGVLPCVAQSPASKKPADSAPLIIQSSPCIMIGGPKSPAKDALLKKKLCAQLKVQEQAAIQRYMAEKNSACYAIRDYQFAIPKGSEAPKLKSYSTCVPAARFEARNVMSPSATPKR